MPQKYQAAAVLALLPAVLLTACGGEPNGSGGASAEKQVGEATCQDYYNAVVDLDQQASKDLIEKLSKDTGVDPNDPVQSEALTYQAFAYCNIDVQYFLQGADIQLQEPEKKLADFTYVRPTATPSGSQ